MIIPGTLITAIQGGMGIIATRFIMTTTMLVLRENTGLISMAGILITTVGIGNIADVTSLKRCMNIGSLQN